ncbi:hypothetical protein K435DRAFT_797252 [Dendrothele bispora CBS 962.96]|uniref:Uncharacterized protein n=1 Tax=Dendrothele bispora (strain CBS 962.96) TaxID=1314807 RepID=A0A4S8M2Z1_DENBC|nr:hypothetical protein K435DRAFT_797252 [Dendrothele bispora CBS 962.96]
MPVSLLTVIFCKKMGNTTIEESSIFNVEVALLGPVISLSLTLTVFGFYTFLFGLSTYFLLKHQFIFRRQLHLVWTTLSFVISTLGALLNDKTQTIITGLALTCFVVANCITDSVLIHRCYIVWGSRKWIILMSVLASILLNSFGLVAVGIKTKGFSNTEANFQLMLKGLDYTLTSANSGTYKISSARVTAINVNAYRLFRVYRAKVQVDCLLSRLWFFCEVKAVPPQLPLTRLEAGILYPLFLVIHAAITANVNVIPIPVDLTPIAIQLAGIAPTFIIVHTCLGQSITEKVVSSYNGTIPTECVDLQSDSSRLPNDCGQKDFDPEVEVGNDKLARPASAA